jgi:hypothetical protein
MVVIPSDPMSPTPPTSSALKTQENIKEDEMTLNQQTKKISK